MRNYLLIILSFVLSTQAQITPPDNAVFVKNHVEFNPFLNFRRDDLFIKLDSASLRLTERFTDTAEIISEKNSINAQLFNCTDTNVFISQWPELAIITEAKDSGDIWRPIEIFSDRFRCPVGAEEDIKLAPHCKLRLTVNFMSGDLKTKIRVKARMRDGTLIISNEVNVSLHPGLFLLNRNGFTGKCYENEDRFMD